MSINTTNQKPENYLIWAILSTLFCCLPLGIVAVVKANQVDSLWLGQRYDEALAASNEAKKMDYDLCNIRLSSSVHLIFNSIYCNVICIKYL